LCYVSHDCELNFADVSDGGAGGKKTKSVKILHKGNPHFKCEFIAEDKVIAGGYDKIPYVYTNAGGDWK